MKTPHPEPAENTVNDPALRPGTAAAEAPTEEFPEPSGELVQPIILLVDREEPCPEDEGIAAAALASVNALLADPRHPYWRPWAQGAFAKSVRRADAKMFAKVAAEFPGHVMAEVGTARAMGFVPMQADSLPKRLAKLQVSGTMLPPGGPLDSTPVRIALNDSLGMSTGKAAAQAAHALFAWVLEENPAELDAWRASGCQLSIQRLDSKAFRKVARTANGPVIRDAGRTEITPGSATAFVSVG